MKTIEASGFFLMVGSLVLLALLAARIIGTDWSDSQVLGLAWLAFIGAIGGAVMNAIGSGRANHNPK
jgi:hypothetical protein